MANEQKIDEVVSSNVPKQLKGLQEDLEKTNRLLADSIIAAEKFDRVLSKTTSLKGLNDAQAKVNTEMLKANKLRDQAIIIEQRKQQAILKTAELEERAAARKVANEEKLAKIENAKIVALAKKGKTIISNSQLEIDAYNNTVNGNKKITSAMTATAIAENKVASAAAAVTASNQKVSVSTLKVSKAAVEAQKSINSLKIQLQSYEAIAGSTQNQQVLEEFNAKIQDTEKKIKQLGNVGKEGFDEFGNAIEETDSGLGGAKESLKDLANALPGIGIGTIIGFATGPIIDYIANLDIFKVKIDQVAAGRRILNDVNLKGAKDAQLEVVQLKTLYETAKNVTLTSEQRYNAAKRLQEQYPKTFENYSIEQIQLGKVDAGYLKLASSIIATAKARASEEKIAENSSRQLDNEQKLLELRDLLVQKQEELITARIRARKLDQGAGDRETAGLRGDAQLRVSEITREIKDTAHQIRDLKTDNNILDQRNLDLTKNIVKEQKKGAEITDLSLKEKKEKVDTSDEDSRKAKIEAARSAAKEVANDEKESYQTRLLSQVYFAEAGDQLAKIDYEKRVDLAKGNNGKILVAQSEYQKELEKYQREARAVEEKIQEDHRTELEKQLDEEYKVRLNANQKQLDQINNDEAKRLDILNQSYADGTINEEQFGEEKLKIQREFISRYIGEEIKQVEDLLQIATLSTDQRADLEEKLADLKLKLSRAVTANQIDENKKLTEGEKKTAKEREDIAKQLADKKKELSNEVFNLGVSIVKSLFENEKNNVQSEIDINDQKRQREIENVDNSVLSQQDKADRIAVINAKADAQNAILEQRKRQIAREQAKFEKAANIASITMSTYAAAAAALRPPPVGLGPIAGIPLAALTIGIGLARVAQVIATPIPQYFKGTDSSKEGLALTDEKGAELYIPRSGKPFIGSDQPNIKNLAAGTQIIPHHELIRMMARPEPLMSVNGREIDLSPLIKAQEKSTIRLERSFSKIKTSPQMSKRALYEANNQAIRLMRWQKRNLS